MELLRVILGVCLLCVFGEAQRGSRLSRQEGTIDPASVSVISNRATIPKIGLNPRELTPPGSTGGFVNIPRGRIRTVVAQINQTINIEVDQDRQAFPAARQSQPQSFPFGPQLLITDRARRIGRSGRLFVETTQEVNRQFSGIGSLTPEDQSDLSCPFVASLLCDARSPFRTITGACNNLGKPLWGQSNTPFVRSVPPAYDDGFSSPRSRSSNNSPLPLPRAISTAIHEASGIRTLDSRFTQITMEFGQFVSHDIERFAAIEGPDELDLVCCDSPTSPSSRFGCLPIEIPANDPFFSTFGRRCMEFARALSTPNLQCELGVREQLNQESAYLDASAVYGSTPELNNELRSRIGGLLRTTPGPDGELLLQDPSLKNPQCRSQRARSCFKAGDARVNQQPALMSMHTIWFREHNRVASALARLNPKWNDEKLFQEARKIVGAEFQHVVYNEFLPVLVGPFVAKAFDFPPKQFGYNSDYDPSINAQIRSSFSSAGYRFGHTLVQMFFADNLKFQDHFLRPDVMYERRKGTSFVIQNLFTNNQQKFDRLISPQLTNTLFEQQKGSGIDLAATNIQRGRDFGTPGYNVFRSWCGLPRATNFGATRGGLVSHSRAAAKLLEKSYSHVDDIDLWTGAISEKVLTGAVVGPTIACIISRQFFVLKKGDRFFYENDDKFAKFSLDQLNEIRKTSFARIICDNTDTTEVQRRVFRFPESLTNPTQNCRNIPSVDLSLWGKKGDNCVDGGWSAWTSKTRCYFNFTIQYRRCNNPTPSGCGKKCVGNQYQWFRCGIRRSGKKLPVEVARELAPKDIVI